MYDTSNPYIWKHYKTVEYPIGQWTITDATLSPDNKFLAYSSIRNIVCLAGTDPSSSTDPILLSFEHGPQGAAFNSMFGTRFGVRYSLTFPCSSYAIRYPTDVMTRYGRSASLVTAER